MKRILCILSVVALLDQAVLAQQGPPPQSGPPQGGPQHQGPPGQGPGQDALSAQLFPPELIMQNQKALNLTDDQKKAIKAEVLSLQSKLTDQQWDFQGEMETLVSLMKESKVDEKKCLAQFDKVIGLEDNVKRAHFTLVVRIKNLLTSDQQAKLMEIRDRSSRRPMPPMGMGGQGPRPNQGGGPQPGGGPRPGGDAPQPPPSE